MSGPARMMLSLCKGSALLLLAGAASWVQAADKAPVNKVLTFGEVAVSLAWSAGWQLEDGASKGMPGSIEFHTPDRMQMVTTLSPIGGMPGLTADEAMKALVTKTSRQFEAQAVEKEIKVQRISSGEAHGYFVCLTDKAPKPGEYEFLCQGLVSLRDLPISFILLYNGGGKADAERALSALKSIRIAAQT